MARKKLTDDEMRARMLAREVARLRESATKSLAAAEEVGIEAKPLVPFPLDKAERAMLAALTTMPDQLQKMLTGRGGKFAVTEVISIVTAVTDSFLATEEERQRSLEWAARKLLSGIHSDLLMPAWRANARKKKPTHLLYQLKVTLIDSKPAIWRRIQVKDCTLDKLHEHIQTVMGWTNSHLHHFDVDGQLYGDPELMEESFHEMNYRDSTITLLSDVVPEDGKRVRFQYDYDFGDSWEHEILFEGCPQPEKGQKYPACVEGERACPPEDVGGVWGYAEFLKTIKSRKRRKRVEMLEWVDGWFDPDEFDAATATKSMWKGILDWRSMG
jgi:hypothetical protein